MPQPRPPYEKLATALFALVGLVLVAGGGTPVFAKGRKKVKPKAVASAYGMPVPVVASALPISSAPAPSVSAPAVAPPAPSAVSETPRLAIGPGTRVLVFGDSMVDSGFAQRLKKLVEARGGKFASDAWTSASTTSWNKGERLANLLAVHQPDVVIVALGANEVFLPSPEAVAPQVRGIVKRLQPRACYWVSPPLWKGETGIVAVERNNSAPCGFFDSGSLQVERAKDGIHPTFKGGTDWADAVWAAVVSPAT